MKARVAGDRWSVLAGIVGLLAAGRAQAQQTCTKDTDCPGTECGSEVCTMSSGLGHCYPANQQGQSGVSDGWCADPGGAANDANCKCRSMGAICDGFYCTLTIPPTGGGGSTGTGGSTGAAGSGGSTGTGGSTGAAGTTGGGGGGDGGCSVAGPPSFGGLAGIALAAALMRRRLRWRR